jgi:hypothetical protein
MILHKNINNVNQIKKQKIIKYNNYKILFNKKKQKINN